MMHDYAINFVHMLKKNLRSVRDANKQLAFCSRREQEDNCMKSCDCSSFFENIFFESGALAHRLHS